MSDFEDDEGVDEPILDDEVEVEDEDDEEVTNCCFLINSLSTNTCFLDSRHQLLVLDVECITLNSPYFEGLLCTFASLLSRANQANTVYRTEVYLQLFMCCH